MYIEIFFFLSRSICLFYMPWFIRTLLCKEKQAFPNVVAIEKGFFLRTMINSHLQKNLINYFVDLTEKKKIRVFFLELKYNLWIAENTDLLINTSTFSRFRRRWIRHCATVAISSNVEKKLTEAFKITIPHKVCSIHFNFQYTTLP